MGGITGTHEGSVQGLHLESASASHKLGARWVTPDGRVFRYAKAGSSAITIGRAVGHLAHSAGLVSDGLPSGAAGRTTAEWNAGSRGFHTVLSRTATAPTR